MTSRTSTRTSGSTPTQRFQLAPGVSGMYAALSALAAWLFTRVRASGA